MKKAVSIFFVGLLTGSILATANTSFAATSLQKVTAYISNFKVMIDGVAVDLDNQPISYNNKTYIPLSDAAQIFGADIKFNNANKAIEINNGGSSSTIANSADPTIKSIQAEYPTVGSSEFDMSTGDFGYSGDSDYSDESNTGTYTFTNRDYAVYMMVMSTDKESKLMSQIQNRFVKMYNLSKAPKTINCIYKGQTVAVING